MKTETVPTLYTIEKWTELFEVAQSRKCDEMRWVAVPNKLDGDGYTTLIDHPDGAAHYGAWCAMLLVASRCKPRGQLVRANGQPHTPETLERMTRIPAKVFAAVLPRLAGHEIGWMTAQGDTARPQPGYNPATATLPPGYQSATTTLPLDYQTKTGEKQEKQPKDESQQPTTADTYDTTTTRLPVGYQSATSRLPDDYRHITLQDSTDKTKQDNTIPAQARGEDGVSDLNQEPPKRKLTPADMLPPEPQEPPDMPHISEMLKGFGKPQGQAVQTTYDKPKETMTPGLLHLLTNKIHGALTAAGFSHWIGRTASAEIADRLFTDRGRTAVDEAVGAIRRRKSPPKMGKDWIPPYEAWLAAIDSKGELPAATNPKQKDKPEDAPIDFDKLTDGYFDQPEEPK